MRNFKRVLSMALALVMMLSMMIVGASAATETTLDDFADADSINPDYSEAIQVMTGTGTFVGTDNGFEPTKTLTRAEAATLIARIILGDENADKLVASEQIFTDVATDHWAAGYITYCAQVGILAGDGAGNFMPDVEVTGVQFGKILLVALGYDASAEGYVGENWATEIAVDMINLGIDVDGVNLSEALTREQCAQMIFQTLEVNTVEYKTSYIVGSVTALTGAEETDTTFMAKYYKDLTHVAAGVVTANEYADLNDDEPLAAGKTTIAGKTYKISTELTDLGESRDLWALGSEVLYLGDSGKNTVYETGAATDITTSSDFEDVTGTVDKKGINSKTETMTVDGTDYVQSHIGTTTATNYMYDVTDGWTEESYDLYLDHFGYVRMFIETDYNVFMLLADGYYYSNNRTESYQANVYDLAEEELVDVDVNDAGDVDEFIDANNGSWGSLFGADEAYGLDPAYATSVAGYSESDDGYTLKLVQNSTNRVSYDVQAIDMDELDDLDDRYLADLDGAADIQTSTNTQYYLVVRADSSTTTTGYTVKSVIAWTGYANAPSTAKLMDGAVGYAVTHESSVGSYNVADVVIFETYAYNEINTYFVYENNNGAIDYAWTLGYDEDGAIVDDRVKVKSSVDEINFYEIDTKGNVNFIGDDETYDSKYIYAGWVSTGYDLVNINYIQLQVVTSVPAGTSFTAAYDEDTWTTARMYIEKDTPIFYLDQESDGDYIVNELDREEVDPGDMVIIFADKDGNVEYAIDVDKSIYTESKVDYIFGDLYTATADSGLWNRIVLDTEVETVITYATTAPYSAVLYDANGNEVATLDETTGNTLAFADWKDIAGAGTIVITPSEGNMIAINGTTGFTSSPITLTTTIGTDEAVAILSQGNDANAVPMTYNYSITYTPASDVTTLTSLQIAYVMVDNDTKVVTLQGGVQMTVQALMDAIEADGLNAELAWAFVSGGTNYTDATINTGASTDDISSFTITVTAEDGTTEVYTSAVGNYAL